MFMCPGCPSTLYREVVSVRGAQEFFGGAARPACEVVDPANDVIAAAVVQTQVLALTVYCNNSKNK